MKRDVRTALRKMATLQTDSKIKLANLAYDAGLIAGQKNYTRFIVLGRSRTGTNLVRSLLNAHSQIHVFGELFRNPDTIDWGLPGYESDEETLTLFRQNPTQFLETRVFGEAPPQIAAIGFKLFYYHAKDPALESLWPHFAADTGLHVIHVKRRNILRTHLSRVRVEQTDVWANTTGVREKEKSITLNYEQCLYDFEQTRRWEEEGDRFFRSHAVMSVIYEKIAGDYGRVMHDVFNFLDVRREPVQPDIHKQSRMPLSAAITNYEELALKFQGTQWASFFED